MSGYCGTCGNTMCVCGEIEKEQDMGKTRDIPRAEVERVRDELASVGREYGALAEEQNRGGMSNREHYSLGREAGLREGASKLDAILDAQGAEWTRPTSTTADMGKSANSIGCSDGGCLFRHNTGQVTNGGCNCVRGQATHTGDGWTIPVQRVKLMIASAVRVARAAREGTE
tara:strand:+ start:1177 stop:1692 length:516 start_codon:yes stop_codon:yes gene_type:complete